MKKRLIPVLVAIIFMSGLGFGASVGTVPGSISVENVEPGDTIEETVYVRADNIETNFTINPSASSRTSKSVIAVDGSETIVSEQGSSEWFSIEEKEIDPTESFIVTSSSLSTEVEGDFEININVPADAEPGTHLGNIRLNTDIEQSGEGAQVMLPGITQIRYSIGVLGDAERDLSVEDIRSFRTNEQGASVEVLFTNEGTVTTSSDDFEIEILDSSGDSVDEIEISGSTLRPGESKWVNGYWEGEGVQEGTYRVDGEVDYITGSTYVSGSFSLSDIIEVVPEDSPTAEGEESGDLPLWLVLMVLVVLGVLMWSFEIDPVWIFGIVGVLGISAFILMSNVSNLLLVGVLIPALLIVYLGV